MGRTGGRLDRDIEPYLLWQGVLLIDLLRHRHFVPSILISITIWISICYEISTSFR
ncbi:hypothetical protein Caka_2758 [Coraliomargarita akajimensis DSM 45221]|uniref:Uncharacterized protein n=1 Tax=Coraliomargarita akajimensis (strain DSM 45221 / IAM 15411 / JCM 23193 / KCTC 12865 / 04OKA010-24) TaxID=583355 RepID=D5EQF9_CORAD|nr:hypothetical protein Caka_2758 [Coraliomargarita akajimensis DSM 45221]